MSRVAEILLQAGKTQADLARQRGEIWGNAVANIAQIPGQVMQAHRQQQRLDAQTALEQAREARLRGQEERAADLERQAHADLEDKRYISGKAWAGGTFNPEAAVGAATERNRADLIPEIQETALKFKPKLVPVTTRDAAGRKITTLQPEALGLTTTTEEPEPPPAGTIGQYLATKAKALGRDLTTQEVLTATKEFETAKQPTPTITPYQEAELKLQRERLAREGQPDQVWVTRNGVLVPITKGTAQPGDVPYSATAGRPSTGEEKKAVAFYNRAREAVDTLTTGGDQSLEHRIANQSTAGQYQQKYAPNLLQTQDQQSYAQAQRAFTEARLRKESGAAIPESEFENDRRTYFAQPGDSAATIEQKRKARDTVLEGLKFGAGKAYEEYYGEPNVSPRQGPQAPKTNPTAAPPKLGAMRTANGETRVWTGSKWELVKH